MIRRQFLQAAIASGLISPGSSRGGSVHYFRMSSGGVQEIKFGQIKQGDMCIRLSEKEVVFFTALNRKPDCMMIDIWLSYTAGKANPIRGKLSRP